MRAIHFLILFALLAQGCGVKGPLYLPEKPAATPQDQKQAPSGATQSK